MKFFSLPPSPSMDFFEKTSFSHHQPSLNHQQSSSAKPSKEMRGDDRLSDLPEHLLHHIFSFLPTNEVNRTTYRLSKKWNRFWASFPYLYFDIKEYEYGEHSDISDFEDYEEWLGREAMDSGTDFEDVRFYCSQQYVEKYMFGRIRSGFDLQGFRLRWSVCGDGYRVKDWMAKAMKLNVQELDIFLGLEDSMFTVPAEVFTAASSVRAVKLESRFDDKCFHQYRFHVPRPMISAPNLRTLELIRVKLPKGNANGELILNCSVLETLILKNCYCKHLKVLNLSLNQLKRLEIDNRGNNCLPNGKNDISGPFDRLGDCKLEMHTPNLSTLVYKGDMYKDCSFGNFVALNDVYILLYPKFVITRPEGLSDLDLFTISKNSNSLKLLKGLNGARTLVLGELEIHFEIPDTLEELLTSYTNLKKLELKASIINYTSLTWLVSLLCRCTSIETLVLHAIQRWREKKEPVWALCPLNHLKYVAVRGLEGDKSEFEFLIFLLKNAVNLERLVITIRESENYESKRGDRQKFHKSLMKLSQRFPNVKVSCRICKPKKPRFAPNLFPF